METTAEEFADRVFASGLGALEIFSIHIGDRLGLYRALSEGSRTSSALADAAGVDERYAREWLEQQAAYGILDEDRPARRWCSPSPRLTVRSSPTSTAASISPLWPGC